jgi:hypothetical protein
VWRHTNYRNIEISLKLSFIFKFINISVTVNLKRKKKLKLNYIITIIYLTNFFDNTVSWDVTPCNRSSTTFRRNVLLPSSGWNSEQSEQLAMSKNLGLLIDREVGGGSLFRNVCKLLLDCTTWYSRKYCFSYLVVNDNEQNCILHTRPQHNYESVCICASFVLST